MSTQTFVVVALALVLAGLGLLRFVANDWLWDRHETLMRARGMVHLERTAEWDTQQNLIGVALLIVAGVLVVVFSTMR